MVQIMAALPIHTEAREYTQNNCIDMEGTSLLTTSQIRSIGSSPFEWLEGFDGYVVTYDGCYNFNNNTTTCPETGVSFGYGCELKYQCY